MLKCGTEWKRKVRQTRETFLHTDFATGWDFGITVVDVSISDQEREALSIEEFDKYLDGDLNPVIVYAHAEYVDSVLGMAQTEGIVWLDGVSLKRSNWLGQREATELYHKAIERSWSKIGNLLAFAGMVDLGERVKTEAALL